jgi:hypothetical protein
VVKLHTGFTFERSRVLKVFNGEDLGASIVGDGAGNVFTSLGYEELTLFRDDRSGTLEASGQIPRKLYVHNRKLFSLNRDSSISVWDITSRELLANIHLLRDGTWRASRP